MFVVVFFFTASFIYVDANLYKVYPSVPSTFYYKSLVPVVPAPVNPELEYGKDYSLTYGPKYGYEGHKSYPKYAFKYGVYDPHTGDHKSQAEERDGDVVKGYYTVAEPDGTLRIVHYTADDHNGFKAVVEKVGHPHHPGTIEKVIPIYEEPVYEYGYGHKDY